MFSINNRHGEWTIRTIYSSNELFILHKLPLSLVRTFLLPELDRQHPTHLQLIYVSSFLSPSPSLLLSPHPLSCTEVVSQTHSIYNRWRNPIPYKLNLRPDPISVVIGSDPVLLFRKLPRRSQFVRVESRYWLCLTTPVVSSHPTPPTLVLFISSSNKKQKDETFYFSDREQKILRVIVILTLLYKIV